MMRFVEEAWTIKFIPPLYIGNAKKAGWLDGLRFTVFPTRNPWDRGWWNEFKERVWGFWNFKFVVGFKLLIMIV